MSDLWHEASADHEREAHEASLAIADAEMMPVYSFLFESRTPRELEHRLAFAAMRIERASDASGVPVAELEDAARRRYALLKEALPEGVDPVTPVLQAGQGFGSGPAEPDGHHEGPDFSHGYSEIPQGAPGGPDPSVVSPGDLKPPDAAVAPVSEATASLCRCGSRLTKKAKCKTCRERPGECMCRTADVTSGTAPVTGMPQTGAGGAMLPAGAGSAAGGGMGAAPILPAGVGAGAPGAPQGAPAGAQGQGQGLDTTPAQTVTASRDPVALQVTAVARSVAASNPMLTESECRRVARRVVGGYLHQADLASGVMSDQPWAPSPGSADGGSGSDGGDGGSGGNMLEHGLEWRGLKGMMPGSGGGAAAGAGGAAELGEVAELAAL